MEADATFTYCSMVHQHMARVNRQQSQQRGPPWHKQHATPPCYTSIKTAVVCHQSQYNLPQIYVIVLTLNTVVSKTGPRKSSHFFLHRIKSQVKQLAKRHNKSSH